MQPLDDQSLRWVSLEWAREIYREKRGKDGKRHLVCWDGSSVQFRRILGVACSLEFGHGILKEELIGFFL